MFADLHGFTALAEQLDPEDLRALQSDYFSLVERIVRNRLGVVEKFIGDAVLAVFGAPVAREGDARRAVQAGLEILAALEERRLGPAGQLPARIAVVTGEVVVDRAAARNRGQAMLSGGITTTAARLQSEAPLNTVLVTAATRRATGDEVEYAEHGVLELRGRARPVRCWRAVRMARPRRWDERPDEEALVGRDTELAALLDAVTEATEKQSPRLVTVLGEAGMGKSRLVRELHRRLDATTAGPGGVRFQWLVGRCPPPGEGGPYTALAEIVAAVAHLGESREPEVVRGALDEALTRLLADGDRVRTVEALTPLFVPTGRPQPGLNQAAAEGATTAWRRLLLRVVEQGPAVLVLEDLHWADDALLDFTERLYDDAAAAGLPLTIVCTARPELFDERRPDWAEAADRRTIRLERLPDAEVRALVRSLFGQVTPMPSLLSRLVDLVGGNPLYAQEYVRMLSDRGGTPGGTAAGSEGETEDESEADPVADLALPETVTAVVTARLDLLEEASREALQAAAVVGETVWPGAVAAITGRPVAEVFEHLDRLRGRGLLREAPASATPGQRAFVFGHVLVRDLAYHQQPRRRRLAGHVAAADWLAGDPAAGQAADTPELLAHHWWTALQLGELTGRLAGHPELETGAREALLAAADRAAQVHAPAAALAHLDRALHRWPADQATASRLDALVRRAEMRLLVDASRFTSEGGPSELAGHATALAELGEPRAAGRAWSLLGYAALHAGDGTAARQHLGRALTTFDRLPADEEAGEDSAGEDRATAYVHLARVGLADGDWAAAQSTADTAGELADRHGLVELAANARIIAAGARYMGGDPDALAEIERLTAYCRDRGLHALRRALYILGVALQEEGDLRRSFACFDEKEALTAGSTAVVVAAVSNDAERAYYAGHWPRLLSAISAHLAGTDPDGTEWEALHLRTKRAWVRTLRGETDATDLDAMLTAAERGGVGGVVTDTLAHGALAHALAGRTDEADRWLTRLVGRCHPGDMPSREWLPAVANAASLVSEQACLRVIGVLDAAPRATAWVDAAGHVAVGGKNAHQGKNANAAAHFAAAAADYERIGDLTDAALSASWAVREWLAAGRPGDAAEVYAVLTRFAGQNGAVGLLPADPPDELVQASVRVSEPPDEPPAGSSAGSSGSSRPASIA